MCFYIYSTSHSHFVTFWCSVIPIRLAATILDNPGLEYCRPYFFLSFCPYFSDNPLDMSARVLLRLLQFITSKETSWTSSVFLIPAPSTQKPWPETFQSLFKSSFFSLKWLLLIIYDCSDLYSFLYCPCFCILSLQWWKLYHSISLNMQWFLIIYLIKPTIPNVS